VRCHSWPHCSPGKYPHSAHVSLHLSAGRLPPACPPSWPQLTRPSSVPLLSQPCPTTTPALLLPRRVVGAAPRCPGLGAGPQLLIYLMPVLATEQPGHRGLSGPQGGGGGRGAQGPRPLVPAPCCCCCCWHWYHCQSGAGGTAQRIRACHRGALWPHRPATHHSHSPTRVSSWNTIYRAEILIFLVQTHLLLAIDILRAHSFLFRV